MLPVVPYIDHFIHIWENSPTSFPVFHREYTRSEKLIREKNFEQFQKKIKQLQSKRKVQQIRDNPGESFFPMFKGFLETVFDFDKEHLEIILSDEFKNVSKDFFDKARIFGPELKPESIYQGLRNVWIMNGIQLMMNLPVEITPSIFAYSMIYPYSDNFLDNPEITKVEKAEFNVRFNQRLHGEKISPQNYTESQLYKLVAMFEEQYNRNDFPEVYNSLYAIQKGQTDSMRLLGTANLSAGEIRQICFEKGGTSVLADGYLVAGKLTREQEQSLIGYGIYLQLLDDIQDVKEDADTETKTIFSCLENENTGGFVNRTIHFGRAALGEMKCFKSISIESFLSLMNRSIETMIIESAGLNNSWFTENYLTELENFSPLHFEFVREKRSQSKSQRFALFQKYFEQKQPEKVFSF